MRPARRWARGPAPTIGRYEVGRCEPGRIARRGCEPPYQAATYSVCAGTRALGNHPAPTTDITRGGTDNPPSIGLLSASGDAPAREAAVKQLHERAGQQQLHGSERPDRRTRQPFRARRDRSPSSRARRTTRLACGSSGSTSSRQSLEEVTHHGQAHRAGPGPPARRDASRPGGAFFLLNLANICATNSSTALNVLTRWLRRRLQRQPDDRRARRLTTEAARPLRPRRLGHPQRPLPRGKPCPVSRRSSSTASRWSPCPTSEDAGPDQHRRHHRGEHRYRSGALRPLAPPRRREILQVINMGQG